MAGPFPTEPDPPTEEGPAAADAGMADEVRLGRVETGVDDISTCRFEASGEWAIRLGYVPSVLLTELLSYSALMLLWNGQCIEVEREGEGRERDKYDHSRNHWRGNV